MADHLRPFSDFIIFAHFESKIIKSKNAPHLWTAPERMAVCVRRSVIIDSLRSNRSAKFPPPHPPPPSWVKWQKPAKHTFQKIWENDKF